jgi:hypothetical protein
VFLVSFARATHPTNITRLDLITLIISGEEFKLRSSLLGVRNIFHPPMTSLFLSTDFLFSNFQSNTFNVRSFVKMRDRGNIAFCWNILSSFSG